VTDLQKFAFTFPWHFSDSKATFRCIAQ